MWLNELWGNINNSHTKFDGSNTALATLMTNLVTGIIVDFPLEKLKHIVVPLLIEQQVLLWVSSPCQSTHVADPPICFQTANEWKATAGWITCTVSQHVTFSLHKINDCAKINLTQPLVTYSSRSLCVFLSVTC